jgi:hypothetical protein
LELLRLARAAIWRKIWAATQKSSFEELVGICGGIIARPAARQQLVSQKAPSPIKPQRLAPLWDSLKMHPKAKFGL